MESENYSYHVCEEAVRWALRRLTFNAFSNICSNCHHFRNLLSRGGFKLRVNTFREPGNVKRIIRAILQDPEAMHVLFLAPIAADGGRSARVIDAYSAIDREWLEKHWRQFLRVLADPRPWVAAMIVDSKSEYLCRVGERLMGCSHFWKQNFDQAADKPVVLDEQRLALFKTNGLPFLRMRPLVGPDGKALNFSRECRPDSQGVAATQDASELQTRANSTVEAAAESSEKTVGGDEPMPPKVVGGNRGLLAGLLPLSSSNGGSRAGILPLSAGSTRSGDDAVESLRRDDINQQLRESLERCQRYEKELSALSAEKTALEASVKDMSHRLDEARQIMDGAIAELRDEKDRQVSAEIEQLRREYLGILAEVEVPIIHNAAGAQAPLEVRVKLALKQQRDRDKRYGTIARIQAEASQLDEMLTQIREAISEAVSVEPELPALEKELEEKIGALKAAMDRAGVDTRNAVDGVPMRFIEQLQQIPLGSKETDSRIDELLSWVDSAAGEALLTPMEKQRIHDVAEKRRKLHHDALYADSFSKSEPQLPAFGGNMKQILRLSAFRDQLPEVELYIDAFNVIKRDQQLSALERTANGFAAARNEFIRKCRRLSSSFNKVILVFDGNLPTDNIERRDDHFEIHWAAKRENSQNADNYIVERLCTRVQEDDNDGACANRWVVTDDFGLLARLDQHQCCGAYIGGELLMSLLR